MIILWGAFRDSKRLAEGRKFLAKRNTPGNDGFLGFFSPEELRGLEENRNKWIDKQLPDPRDGVISRDLARVYWRIATHKAETSDMLAEVVIVVASVTLGIVGGNLWIALSSAGFQLAEWIALPAIVFTLVLVVLAYGVSSKVAASRRWQEAIRLYARLGWPEEKTVVNVPKRNGFRLNWFSR
ncbi:MAG: hypothetical protein WED09_10430 [Homoserinimonas sp.]